MADTGPVVLGICSGVGMLEAAVRVVFPGTRTAAVCEWEAYAAAVQLARMEDQSMEPTPLWCGDIGGFDARPFLGVVDILVAGLPCQPYSSAGKRNGNKDARSHGADGISGPLPQTIRILEECRPALVFFENVPAWVRQGWFRAFGDELCRVGYEIVEPVFIAASDVGASHQRERVFILGVGNTSGVSIHRAGNEGLRWTRTECGSTPRRGEVQNTACGRQPGISLPTGRRTEGQGTPHAGGAMPGVAETGHRCIQEPERGQEGRNGIESAGEVLGESDQLGKQQPDNPTSTKPRRNAWPCAGGTGSGLADTELAGPQRESAAGFKVQNNGAAGRSGGTEVFAPGPGDFDGWNRTVEDGSFDFKAPAIEPGVRVLANGLALLVDASRADQLRCAGNGVVVLQAAVALVELLQRANLINANTQL